MFNSRNIFVKASFIWKHNTRSFRTNQFETALWNLFSRESSERKPYYSHVCQIGDPVLRTQSKPVHPDMIQTADFQKALDHLKKMMRYYGLAGLAAPQIGLPWQIFVIELTEDDLHSLDAQTRTDKKIEIIPLKFFINPRLEIKDHETTVFPEMCQSICGYTANVPRPREVEVEAIDREGQSFTWLAKEWSARIVQHEYDHLQGVFFVDKMITSTFKCSRWREVNNYKGKIALPFRPQSSVK